MKEKTFAARGILAGICISMGGAIYLKVGGVAGAVLFAFGLIAVVSLGLNLFTGKAQFVWPGQHFASISQGGMPWLLAILLLNIAGCAAMALLFSSPDMQEASVGILMKRLANEPLRNLFLSMGCGFIMTLAVQGAAKGKWLPLLFGIPAFILCGFPHCIADAFYICALPHDFLAGHAAELLLFYGIIVCGNYLGCNAYRLLNPTTAPDTAPSQSPRKTATQTESQQE